MDIWYYIIIILIIGIFFFLDKYSTSFNPMMFVIIFSLLGFFFVLNEDIEIVDYTALNKVNNSYVEHPKTDITNAGFGSLFNVQSFFVVVYFFTLVLGIINMALGKKESNVRS